MHIYQASIPIDIPENVTIIGNPTPQNCTSLKEIILCGNASSVGTDWASGCSDNLTISYQPGAIGSSTHNGMAYRPIQATIVTQNREDNYHRIY